MPFLLAEILDFQGSAHLIGVGSLSHLYLYFGTEKQNDKKNKNIVTNSVLMCYIYRRTKEEGAGRRSDAGCILKSASLSFRFSYQHTSLAL